MLAIGPLAGPTKTLVGQATRDNDSPPSGYQLELLCKASFASPSECDQLFDSIIRRLDSNSANVKWKTLRVISYLCQHGNPSIRKEFQRKIDRIRICTGFSGALHPLRGDAPNERVRVAAKDALSALFSTPDPHPQYSNPKISHLSGGQSPGLSSDQDSVLGSTFKSVLSSAASLVAQASSSSDQISSYRPSNSSYQITGIGNSSFHRSNSQPSSVFDKMKQVLDPRWKSNSVSQPSGYAGLPLGGGPANRGDFDVKPAMLEGVQPRRRGQVGGNWAEDDSDVRLPKAAPTRSRPSDSPPSDSQAIQSRDTDMEFGALEHRIVDELTSPGGVAATPPPDQLSALLCSLQSLDLSLIAELLSRKLDEDQSWQTQAKALFVIATLLNENCHEIGEHFAMELPKIISLSSSKLRAVRAQADKVYAALSKTSFLKQSEVPQSSPQAPDLLDFPTSSGATVDFLEMSSSNNSTIPASTSQNPLGFLMHQNDTSTETPSMSFPFISNSDNLVSQSTEIPCFTGQTYMSLSESNVAPLKRDTLSSLNELSFLGNSGPGSGHSSSRPNLSIAENIIASTPSMASNFAAASPVSSFSFVSQAVPDKSVSSEKPLDPFANAIKTVRKNEVPSRDSFSFVQDMMKGSTNSR